MATPALRLRPPPRSAPRGLFTASRPLAAARDAYAVLGIERAASNDEIKARSRDVTSRESYHVRTSWIHASVFMSCDVVRVHIMCHHSTCNGTTCLSQQYICSTVTLHSYPRDTCPICIHVYTYMQTCIYTESTHIMLCCIMSCHTVIYIYIYICIERER